MIAPPLSPFELAALDAEFSRWEGTPFHHAARVPGVGVDCANLMIALYAATGRIREFNLPEYPPDWSLHRSAERFLSTITQHGDEIDAAEAAPGDAIVMRYGRTFSHGAVLLDDGVIGHAYLGRPVSRAATDDYRDKPWRIFRVRMA